MCCVERELGTDEAVERDWKVRWNTKVETRARSRGGTSEELDVNPEFQSKRELGSTKALRNTRVPLLVQVRTGKIGLRVFLFQRKAPDVNMLLCCRGIMGETPAHVALFCPELQHETRQLRQTLLPQTLQLTRDLAAATIDPASEEAV